MNRCASKMTSGEYDGWDQLSGMIIYMKETPTWEDGHVKWLQAAKPLEIAVPILQTIENLIDKI